MSRLSAQIAANYQPKPLVHTEAMADAWLYGLMAVSVRHRTAFGSPAQERFEEARRYFFAAGRYNGRLHR